MVDFRAVILVEGISDRVAVETLAERRGRELATQGVSVVPMGGAEAIGRKSTSGAIRTGAISGAGGPPRALREGGARCGSTSRVV